MAEIHFHYEHPFRYVYHTLRWLSDEQVRPNEPKHDIHNDSIVYITNLSIIYIYNDSIVCTSLSIIYNDQITIPIFNSSSYLVGIPGVLL
jgi:hypothetical protein